MKLDYLIREVQGRLGVEVDGKAGPETWCAIHAKICGKSATLPTNDDAVDARSEKAIATLLPQVQPYARALLHEAAKQGIKLIVTSATRTYDEQNALYAQGRTKPGEKVTNARGGQSWHNHRCAFDVTIFSGSKPIYESPSYKAVGAIGQSLGLEWGGSWKTIVDEPHFQLTNGKTLAEAQDLHDQGKTVFG